MSVVERAISKLQKARGAGGGSGREGSAGRYGVVNPAAPAAPGEAHETTARREVIEVDLEALGRAGLLAPGNPRLADEYRMIKQPLLKKAAEGGRSTLLMVTSAFAGEGKTFTCLNLGLSFATEKDWRVLLVDVDCKNPSLSDLLGMSGRPGLMNVLKNPTLSLDSVIMGTSIDGLSVLALGEEDDHAAELLSSSRMNSLCAQLAEKRGQLVLFDSAPVLLTAETSILSGHVGQTIFVVAANKTPRQAVLEAVQKLDHSKAIGLVLNGADGVGETLRYGVYESGDYTQRTGQP